jgi:predicted GNAT family acetyltransferase
LVWRARFVCSQAGRIDLVDVSTQSDIIRFSQSAILVTELTMYLSFVLQEQKRNQQYRSNHASEGGRHGDISVVRLWTSILLLLKHQEERKRERTTMTKNSSHKPGLSVKEL